MVTELTKKIRLLKGVGEVSAVIGLVFLVISIVFSLVSEEYDLPGTGELLVDMFAPGLVCFIAGCALYLTGYFVDIVKE